MMLSEAIRVGAMWREQCVKTLFDGEKSCAIGAAVEAIGLRNRAMLYGMYHPSGNGNILGMPFELIPQVAKLNDGGMTREAISDWLVESGRDVEIPGTSVPVVQPQKVEVSA